MAVAVREPLPRLLYDSTTGDVRLWVPGEDGRWTLETSDLVLTTWERSGPGRSAEVVRPLPIEFNATSPSGKATSFICQPKDWPGLWFRASNGHLKPGDDVDRDGLEPGRWLTVFEGKPEGNVGVARPLNWCFVRGGQDWTAWEVDVPPRTPGRDRLVWKVDENAFSVPLARRPSPRIEVRDAPLATSSCEGLEVQVFDRPPTVAVSRDHGVAVRLARRLGGKWLWVQDLNVPEDRSVRLPADSPGVYQLRESRNVGRVLLDFAVLPGFREISADVDANFERVTWVLSADTSLGQFHPAREAEQQPSVSQSTPNSWEVEASTIEPYLTVVWDWTDPQVPTLQFDKPVEGLRWRIKGLSLETGRWTRSRILIDPKQVLSNPEQARIEVQAPRSGTLMINGVAVERAVDGDSGKTIIRELAAYLSAEHVQLGFMGCDYSAVLLARRPIVERLSVEAGEEDVIVNWWPRQPEGTVLMAWDPLSPQVGPIYIPLTPEQLSGPEKWVGSRSDLPIRQT